MGRKTQRRKKRKKRKRREPTEGNRQIEKEKQGLVFSQIYFTCFRLASEPHQTLVIIACQLVTNRVAFRERGSLLSVNYQHNEKATFLLLHVCALCFTGWHFWISGFIFKSIKNDSDFLFCFLMLA